jgi:hypothetical protein
MRPANREKRLVQTSLSSRMTAKRPRRLKTKKKEN